MNIVFEREGLLFAHFVQNRTDGAQITFEDALKETLQGESLGPISQQQALAILLEVLRGMLYTSTKDERTYLLKLSRTYALLFTLKTDPKLVKYFQEMKANFELFIGTDILVRALSERYLMVPSQMTRNMLRMLADAGADLVLTEPVLDEVWNHLKASDKEFENYFANAEAMIPLHVARNSEKILIRSYFYAKRDPEAHTAEPKSWSSFLNQFCPYSELKTRGGSAALRDYLTRNFRLRWMGNDELFTLIVHEEIDALTEKFAAVKSQEVLARYDATLALGVYARRKAKQESNARGEFGYRTWWLTREAAIITPAGKLIAEHDGSRFMMRPEFLLNFIALAPSAKSVRDTYASVFPTMQGIRLANRMADKPFLELMRQVDDAMELEEGRREAEVARLADKLMGDFGRKYRISLSADS